jgi:DNA helicase HerA-like ATPase
MSEMSRHAVFQSAQESVMTSPQTPGTTVAHAQAAGDLDNALRPIGVVRDVSGGTAHVVLDPDRLHECLGDADPAIAMSGQVASQIKIRVGQTWLLGVVRTMRQATPSEEHGGIVAEVDFLGEGGTERLTGNIRGFRRGVTRYPMPGALAHVATSPDLRQIYASDGRANIGIGTVHPTRDIRAGLYIDSFLGKHFALLGSTGTGKSTAASLILHRICELAPEGHIVMIDPHGEYISAFRDRGHLLDVSNLQMPYWLMNFEEHCEVFLTSSGSDRVVDADILARCLQQARSKNRLAAAIGKITVDSPIPYLLSDLLIVLQNEMGKLDKGTGSIPYQRIRTKIEEIRADPRYQFMFSGMLVGDCMTDFIAQVFRLPADGKPISIIDVSGVPSEITQTVVAVLSRLVFDFAVWARDEETRPILLVCEEAHRYVPNERNSDGSSVARVLSRIAKEGRKYGVSLGLITQRPSDLAEGVLSQCGTIIAMRLNNERDQAHVRAAMPEGARGFMDAIPALRNRECIVCGEGVSIAMRVSFDDLDAALRPASADPSFSTQWGKSGGEEAMINRTTQRWRAQSR